MHYKILMLSNYIPTCFGGCHLHHQGSPISIHQNTAFATVYLVMHMQILFASPSTQSLLNTDAGICIHHWSNTLLVRKQGRNFCYVTSSL